MNDDLYLLDGETEDTKQDPPPPPNIDNSGTTELNDKSEKETR